MAIQQGGMFGPTPEEIQQALLQQQGADDWQQATAWGRGNLANQISTAGFMGGSMLGRGLESLGRGAGVLPEDPRLAEAKKMMEIKKAIMSQGIDPQDIDNFYPALIEQLYKGGMIDKATQLQKDYQTLSNQQDAIRTRQEAAKLKLREEKLPGIAIHKALSASLKDEPSNAPLLAEYFASIDEANPVGNQAILANLKAILNKKQNGQDVKVGVDTKTNLPVFVSRDPAEPGTYVLRKGQDGRMAKVFGEFDIRDESAKVMVGGSNINTLDKVTEQGKRFDSAVKPYLDRIRQVDNFVTQYQQASTDGNSAADRAMDQMFAATFKADSQVSKAEMDAIINSGSLPAQITNKLKMLVDGTKTQMSRDEKLAAVTVLRKAAMQRALKVKETWKRSAVKNNISTEDQDLITSSLDALTEPLPTGSIADAAARELEARRNKGK